MNHIYSGYNKPTGEKLYYVILNDGTNDNGFDIYVEGASCPILHQPEPFIPYPNISYEENAKKMCEEMSITADTSNIPKSLEERITDVEANIDYLMLLNDADSATEDETE